MLIESTASPKSVAQTLSKDIKSRLDTSGLSQNAKDEIQKLLEEQEKEISYEVPNTFVYKAAVIGVLLICLVIVGGAIVQPSQWAHFPEFLKLTLSTAIGAVAGMIVPQARA